MKDILEALYQLFILPTFGMLFDILLGGIMVGVIFIACNNYDSMIEYFKSKKKLQKRANALYDELKYYEEENDKLRKQLSQKSEPTIFDGINYELQLKQLKEKYYQLLGNIVKDNIDKKEIKKEWLNYLESQGIHFTFDFDNTDSNEKSWAELNPGKKLSFSDLTEE